uniref:Uncharacterized protein n=1 Tax=Arundo donax TaxID=35708 RepID=A0A0A9B2Y5_ARUDO
MPATVKSSLNHKFGLYLTVRNLLVVKTTLFLLARVIFTVMEARFYGCGMVFTIIRILRSQKQGFTVAGLFFTVAGQVDGVGLVG